MSGIDERHKQVEAALAHDSELRFRVTNRRNKLLGLWAADLMGIEGDAANEYAKEVVKADFEEVGDDDVIRKVLADLTAKGIASDADAIRAKLDEVQVEAHTQIVEGD